MERLRRGTRRIASSIALGLILLLGATLWVGDHVTVNGHKWSPLELIR